MLDSPVGLLFSSNRRLTPDRQVQRLHYFLIDQLKFFLIGCASIAQPSVGTTDLIRLDGIPPETAWNAVSFLRRHLGNR